jgi:predicted phage terminase large subunit-like protein
MSTEQEISVNELAFTAALCRDSFYDFAKEHWPEVSQEEPVWNWHVQLLCKEMQAVAERVFKGEESPYDVVVNIPPGTTKSTICSIMFPAWVWTRMPHAQFICASHTDKIAFDLARRCRDIVISTRYTSLFPELGTAGEWSTAIGQLLNRHKGFRLSVGTGGITGFHAHFIIIDDPIDPESSNSEADRLKANRWMSQTLPSRKVNKMVTPTILIMQRLHQADPSALMLGEMREMKWGSPVRHICLPATETDKVRPEKLRRFYKDGLLDPIRLGKKVIAALRSKLGKYGASCQLDQSPVPAEGGLIDVSKLRYGRPPPIKRFVSLCRFWDKAGTHQGGKRTAGVLLGEDPEGRFWVLHVNKGQWGSGDRERHIKAQADLDGRIVTIGLEQEPGSGGKESAENTVKNLSGYKVIADRPTGDKSDRADPFAAQVDIGNVYIALNADGSTPEWVPEYVDELKYFPNGEFSDQVDGTSGSFNLINKPRVHLGAWGRKTA